MDINLDFSTLFYWEKFLWIEQVKIGVSVHQQIRLSMGPREPGSFLDSFDLDTHVKDSRWGYLRDVRWRCIFCQPGESYQCIANVNLNEKPLACCDSSAVDRFCTAPNTCTQILKYTSLVGPEVYLYLPFQFGELRCLGSYISKVGFFLHITPYISSHVQNIYFYFTK